MIEVCETWKELIDWCWNKGIYIDGEWGQQMTEILTIKRKKDTKQAIGYTWVANFISRPFLFPALLIQHCAEAFKPSSFP